MKQKTLPSQCYPLQGLPSLPHKKKPINILVTELIVKIVVHRASLSLSLSMVSLTTVRSDCQPQTSPEFERTSPFMTGN